MRILSLILIIELIISCNTNSGDRKSTSKARDTIRVHDTIVVAKERNNWQEYFELTHDPDVDSVWFQPVSYYLNDPDCSGLARDFYYGSLRPSDDGTTDELLKLATTNDHKLRPFYRWCLNLTIIIEDGALAEHTGIPARKYAEKFPEEFIRYMDIDTSGQRYEDWVGSISYSGFYDGDDYRKPKAIARRFADAMKQNCKSCSQKMLTRIDTLARECFY